MSLDNDNRIKLVRHNVSLLVRQAAQLRASRQTLLEMAVAMEILLENDAHLEGYREPLPHLLRSIQREFGIPVESDPLNHKGIAMIPDDVQQQLDDLPIDLLVTIQRTYRDRMTGGRNGLGEKVATRADWECTISFPHLIARDYVADEGIAWSDGDNVEEAVRLALEKYTDYVSQFGYDWRRVTVERGALGVIVGWCQIMLGGLTSFFLNRQLRRMGYRIH